MKESSDNVRNSDIPLLPKVVQYEQFLNDTLRGDLKYVKFSHTLYHECNSDQSH